MGRTPDRLEAGEGIPLGMAAGRRSGRQVHRDRRVRIPVAHPVPALAAVEAIGARAALDPVDPTVADEGVGVGRTPDRLEAGEGIPLGMAAGRRSGRQVHRDRRVRIPVAHPVPALAAVEAIGARASVDAVVAGTAVEPVVARPAAKRVVARAAVQHVVAAQAGDVVVAVESVYGIGCFRTAQGVVSVRASQRVVSRAPTPSPQLPRGGDVVAGQAIAPRVGIVVVGMRRPRHHRAFDIAVPDPEDVAQFVQGNVVEGGCVPVVGGVEDDGLLQERAPLVPPVGDAERSAGAIGRGGRLPADSHVHVRAVAHLDETHPADGLPSIHRLAHDQAIGRCQGLPQAVFACPVRADDPIVEGVGEDVVVRRPPRIIEPIGREALMAPVFAQQHLVTLPVLRFEGIRPAPTGSR